MYCVLDLRLLSLSLISIVYYMMFVFICMRKWEINNDGYMEGCVVSSVEF